MSVIRDWKFRVAILCSLGIALQGCSTSVPANKPQNDDDLLTQPQDKTEGILSPSELRERRLALKKSRESQLAALYAAHGHQIDTATTPQQVQKTPHNEQQLTPKISVDHEKQRKPTPESKLLNDTRYTIQLGVFRSRNNLKSALEKFPLDEPLFTFKYTAELSAYAAGNFRTRADAQKYTNILIKNGIHEFHIRRLPKHFSAYKKTQP